MATIMVNGVGLAYDDEGSGPAIVFSHAGVADRRMWDHQFEHLAPTHRVVRYDWRGYGGSADAEGDFSHSEDLLGLLAAYAEGRPVRDEDARAMAEAHGRFLIAGPGRDPSAVTRETWAKAIDMATGVFHRLWSGPPSTERLPDDLRLQDIRTKTLVVNGLEDAPWIQELQTRIAEEVPGARRVDLPDTGHLPPLERPAESTRLIREHAQ